MTEFVGDMNFPNVGNWIKKSCPSDGCASAVYNALRRGLPIAKWSELNAFLRFKDVVAAPDPGQQLIDAQIDAAFEAHDERVANFPMRCPFNSRIACKDGSTGYIAQKAGGVNITIQGDVRCRAWNSKQGCCNRLPKDI